MIKTSNCDARTDQHLYITSIYIDIVLFQPANGGPLLSSGHGLGGSVQTHLDRTCQQKALQLWLAPAASQSSAVQAGQPWVFTLPDSNPGKWWV